MLSDATSTHFTSDNLETVAPEGAVALASLLAQVRTARPLTLEELDATEAAFVDDTADEMARRIEIAKTAGFNAAMSNVRMTDNPFPEDFPLERDAWFAGHYECCQICETDC